MKKHVLYQFSQKQHDQDVNHQVERNVLSIFKRRVNQVKNVVGFVQKLSQM